MSKTIYMKNGILTLSESKAICPKCNRKIPFDEIENKWVKQDNSLVKMKCKCNKYIGITQNIKGDFVAFDLKPIES